MSVKFTRRQRFWQAVMAYAMKRTGLRRYNHPEPTDEEWAAYAAESQEWAALTFPAGAASWPPYSSSNATNGNGTVTWTRS